MPTVAKPQRGPATLRVLPNPFVRLDHAGVPNTTYPFDPTHSPDRRWVGAVVDRAVGPDGLPRTRKLDTPGDLTVMIGGRKRYVDRSPRKRIQFRHDVEQPTVLPVTGHYLRGIRQGALVAADSQTAAIAGLAFVDPAVALRRAAERAISTWEREYGEPPDVDSWPPNLRSVAGLDDEPEAAETKTEDPAALAAVEEGAS